MSKENKHCCVYTQSGAGGEGVGAVRWWAALAHVSSELVVEVHTVATVMLGAKMSFT